MIISCTMFGSTGAVLSIGDRAHQIKVAGDFVYIDGFPVHAPNWCVLSFSKKVKLILEQLGYE
jgi:hypothetical protein